MIVSNFVMFAAAYAGTTHTAALSTIAMRESLDNTYTINVTDKLSPQPSIFREAIVTAEQHKQFEHNFDANLRQIDVVLFDTFDSCKNFKVVQTTLKHCYKQTKPQYSSEQVVSQTVWSFYNTGNFKNDPVNASMRKISSPVEVVTSALVDKESQEVVQLHKGETEQIINVESLPTSPEEDVFTYRASSGASSVHDAFTVENSSLGKQQE
ncbi:trwN protein [Bartonella alsatica]|uniref:Uncharacterized protein n=2 Tax=Bartonella alsatica TaxID=52764 RepID=J0PWW8_9HYPH|nr:hypothetical protein [Bartonella alsatica]EJF74699.1 hypothetical protein MEC_01223 [Bartonella alsatica IBS 382]QLC51957.1 trwN protein [Bartonella alsatica]